MHAWIRVCLSADGFEDLDRTHGRIIRDGVMILEKCSARLGYPPKASIGPLGWPCPTGGVVQFRERNALGIAQNCVIFYHQNRVKEKYDAHRLVVMFKAILSEAITASFAPRLFSASAGGLVDLTALAAQFGSRAPALQEAGSWPAHQFKLVAFIPVIEPSYEQMARHFAPNYLSSHVGLSADGGLIAVDHLNVPMPIDLNEAHHVAVTVYVISAIPSFGWT